MPSISFSGVLLVAAIAFAVPLLLGLVPKLGLPVVVLELVAGILVGPSGLGWIHIDLPIQVLSLLGLAFLLFLAGLEIDVERLRGRPLHLAGLGFVLSFGAALLIGLGLRLTGLIAAPVLIAIILSATALGILLGILKDVGHSATPFGQLVLAGASIADVGTVILLSLFFSRQAHNVGTQIVLVGGLMLVGTTAVFALRRFNRALWVASAFRRLQDTSAQIRVRGAFALLAGFATLAQHLGLEVILGAFMAGVILSLVDGDRQLTHPHFRAKLEAIGFGIFIPVFFVASGVQFQLHALLAGPATLALVPVFLLALLVSRGLPAFLYRPLVGTRGAVAAGLLQATSLPFIVAATQIGLDLRLLRPATGAALIAAGLLSVVLFPAMALTILGRGGASPRQAEERQAAEEERGIAQG